MFIQLQCVVREAVWNADVSLFNVYLLSAEVLLELAVHAIKHKVKPFLLLHWKLDFPNPWCLFSKIIDFSSEQNLQ